MKSKLLMEYDPSTFLLKIEIRGTDIIDGLIVHEAIELNEERRSEQ